MTKTAEQIVIASDTQNVVINKDYEDRLVAGGFIYHCHVCCCYHVDAEHSWQTLSAAITTIKKDIVADTKADLARPYFRM